jgi:hypothetical protein
MEEEGEDEGHSWDDTDYAVKNEPGFPHDHLPGHFKGTADHVGSDPDSKRPRSHAAPSDTLSAHADHSSDHKCSESASASTRDRAAKDDGILTHIKDDPCLLKEDRLLKPPENQTIVPQDHYLVGDAPPPWDVGPLAESLARVRDSIYWMRYDLAWEASKFKMFQGRHGNPYDVKVKLDEHLKLERNMMDKLEMMRWETLAES